MALTEARKASMIEAQKAKIEKAVAAAKKATAATQKAAEANTKAALALNAKSQLEREADKAVAYEKSVLELMLSRDTAPTDTTTPLRSTHNADESQVETPDEVAAQVASEADVREGNAQADDMALIEAAARLGIPPTGAALTAADREMLTAYVAKMGTPATPPPAAPPAVPEVDWRQPGTTTVVPPVAEIDSVPDF
jgi:multidrug efflux pump subunit AcrA (membrane-fusion protein)